MGLRPDRFDSKLPSHLILIMIDIVCKHWLANSRFVCETAPICVGGAALLVIRMCSMDFGIF